MLLVKPFLDSRLFVGGLPAFLRLPEAHFLGFQGVLALPILILAQAIGARLFDIVDLACCLCEVLLGVLEALGRRLLQLVGASIVTSSTAFLVINSLLVLHGLSKNVWHLVRSVGRLVEVAHHGGHGNRCLALRRLFLLAFHRGHSRYYVLLLLTQVVRAWQLSSFSRVSRALAARVGCVQD